MRPFVAHLEHRTPERLLARRARADLTVEALHEERRAVVLHRPQAHDERGYRVLQPINTQPAITYLKKVTWDKA